jgi:hypothetical protein
MKPNYLKKKSLAWSGIKVVRLKEEAILKWIEKGLDQIIIIVRMIW